MKYDLIAELEITDQSWVPDYIKNVTGWLGATVAGTCLARRKWRESKAKGSPQGFL